MNNNNNINVVRAQIASKINSSRAYYGTYQDAEQVITDQDHFPYTRYFRGVYDSPQAVVFEREAGYRPLNNRCYRKLVDPSSNPVKYCWEYPCSTLFPCMPSPDEEKPRCFTISP